MSWTTYSVGDLCEVFDGPHATPTPSLEGPIYLGITSIRHDGTIDFENSKRISYEDYPKWTKRVIPQESDVVFSYEANLESFAIIPEGFEGCLGRRMAIMRPNKEKIEPRFLYYYLLSPKWKAVIAQKTVLGATVNRIPIATYPSFPIDIPSLEEQRRIAGILSAYDSLIENNRKQIKLLEETAQRLYKEWFIDLRFPGHENTEIDSETGLPKGWKKATLGDFALIEMGQSPKSEYYNAERRGMPFHQGVSSYGVRFVEDSMYTEKAAKIGCAGSILFSVRAPVGRINLTRNDVAIGRGLSAINHKYGLQSLLLYRLKNRFYRDNLMGNGSIYSAVSKDELMRTPFETGTFEIEEAFNSVVSAIDQKIDLLDRSIIAASEARDRLLPKLMSREIEA